MQSNASRALIALAAVAVVVVGFFVIKGGDDSDETTTASDQVATTTTEATTPEEPVEKQEAKPKDEGASSGVPEIVVTGGEPEDGVTELDFNKGDEVEFVVASDQADEIHVHGYDIEEEVPAGGEAKFAFPADIEGVFEVELHESGAQVAQLTVNP